jgi:hypothetical protein
VHDEYFLTEVNLSDLQMEPEEEEEEEEMMKIN